VFFRSSSLVIAGDEEEGDVVFDSFLADDDLVDSLLNLEMTLILSITEPVTFLKICKAREGVADLALVTSVALRENATWPTAVMQEATDAANALALFGGPSSLTSNPM
jgi:hypothetical protein